MNGWPDKPGVPRDPEKDGWHWIYDKYLGPECALWIAKSCCWQMAGAEVLSIQKWRYLGPCFTPDGTAALQARIAELERALDFYACVDHYQIHNAAAPNVVQFDRGAKARAALEGGKKDE